MKNGANGNPNPPRKGQFFKGLTQKVGVVSDGLRVGLKPDKGWALRNYRFLRRRLLPTILQKRSGIAIPEAPSFMDLEDREIEVIWIGHASFLVRTPWANILIDPNWALWHGPVKRARHPGLHLDHLPPVDCILITHAHYDHLHRGTLKKIANGQTVLAPKGVGCLIRDLKFGEVREMDIWEHFSLGETEIVLTPSYHWGARFIHDTHRGFGGFLIKTPHSSLYHCGDSAYFDGFSEIGKRYDIDTALLPIGAYEAPSGRDVHMNPEEAIQAFEDLGANQMIPMHYGTFPLGNECIHEPIKRLSLAAEEKNIGHRVLSPMEGEPVRLMKELPPLMTPEVEPPSVEAALRDSHNIKVE